MTSVAQHLEALLFTAGEAVAISELTQILHTKEEDILQGLQELQENLAEHGLALVTTKTHAQLVTSPSVAEFLAQFISQENRELSKAALETLSVIAYRGPISRYDVDSIRGVDSRRMIRQLLLRGLVTQIRVAGKSSLFDIAEEALMHLGVTKKEDLPQFEELSTHEQVLRLLTKE